MKTKTEAKTPYTLEEIKTALDIFIDSGSANGDEDMRKFCLKKTSQFAAAPELVEAAKYAIEAIEHSNCDSKAADGLKAALKSAGVEP